MNPTLSNGSIRAGMDALHVIEKKNLPLPVFYFEERIDRGS